METARALADNLSILLRREHEAMADFLVALADFDRIRGWAELRYGSLFQFLNRHLRLSLGAAQYRKVAAQVIQSVPAVVDPLRDGRLCFTSIIEVAKVVSADNWETVLPRFYGLSRREAAEVVAELRPQPAPPLRTVLTGVRPAASHAPSCAAPSTASAPQPESADAAPSAPPISLDEVGPVSSSTAQPATPAAKVVPLTAELRRLCVTVSKSFADKLEAARHARPDLTLEQILEKGVDLLLGRSAKAKGLVDRPQKKIRPSNDESRIPARLKREAMKRAGGRCECVLANGERCGSTHDLEFHHVTARAKGGQASTVDDIRVTCRAHNVLEACRDFGDEVMLRYTRRGRRRAHVTNAAHGRGAGMPDTPAASTE
jgi:hypothetical protein